jgi:hypothetical protein
MQTERLNKESNTRNDASESKRVGMARHIAAILNHECKHENHERKKDECEGVKSAGETEMRNRKVER